MKIRGEIILIDDEQYEEEFLKEVLDALRYEVKVTYFSDAIEAHSYIRHTHKDIFLIISDIHMAAMSGIRLKQILNNDPNTALKSIPFVFTTNHASKKNIEEAYKQNIQGFFKKPVGLKNLTELFSIIIKYWLVNMHPNQADSHNDKEVTNILSK